MEIIERSQIFNDNFRTYIKNDTSNYLGKLLEFASSEEDIEETLILRTDEFQTELLEYVLSQETSDDYESDIDEIRKERVDNLLYDINNYLVSIEPYNAVKMFLDGNFKELFIKSKIYCDSYRKQIIDKINEIMVNTKLEYKQNKMYNKSINQVVEHMESRNNEIIFYESMTKNMVHINKDTSLKEYEEYVDSLLFESYIINRFDERGRTHISFVINQTVNHPELGNTNHYMANICESVLINYVLLDLYSTEPEQLKISDKMLESIVKEVEMGTVTKEDIMDSILNGPIRFTPEEIEYIDKTFMKRIFNREDKITVEKIDLLKLVK